MVDMSIIDRGHYVECVVPQRSEEWHALRMGKITGSRFGDALDIGHRSARALQKDIEADKKFKGNNWTEHGKTWEDYATATFSHLTGWRHEAMGFAIPKKAPFIGVSPDGVLFDDDISEAPLALLEVKCPATKATYNGIPPAYMAQVQGNMGVLGLSLAYFVVFRPRSVRRDGFTEGAMPDSRSNAFGVHPDDPNYGLAPDELYIAGKELHDKDDDNMFEAARLEVWKVKRSKEYQVALFEGLRYFWSCVIGKVQVPVKSKNRFRERLEACEVEFELETVYVDDGEGGYVEEGVEGE